jgi:hypothetical protein
MCVSPIERAAVSMTSGAAGLKIDWFENAQPTAPVPRAYPRFVAAVESKPLFHVRNKKSCCSNDTESAQDHHSAGGSRRRSIRKRNRQRIASHARRLRR